MGEEIISDNLYPKKNYLLLQDEKDILQLMFFLFYMQLFALYVLDFSSFLFFIFQISDEAKEGSKACVRRIAGLIEKSKFDY